MPHNIRLEIKSLHRLLCHLKRKPGINDFWLGGCLFKTFSGQMIFVCFLVDCISDKLDLNLCCVSLASRDKNRH